MKLRKVEFVKSTVDFKEFPKDDKPEICFVGRSNVGKSSLINSLLNRKKLAKTSSKPGKTRTINFYEVNNEFRFVDLPGYGYASVSRDTREKWSPMIEGYLLKRENLCGVVQLIDIRHNPTELDIMMNEWLHHYNLPKIIAATKCDKIGKSRQRKYLEAIKKSLNFLDDDYLIMFSAKTGRGKAELWKAILSLINKK